jgi:hypothetical protein
MPSFGRVAAFANRPLRFPQVLERHFFRTDLAICLENTLDGVDGHACLGGNFLVQLLLRKEKTAVLRRFLVELGGLEPPTSWVRSRRSPN